MKTSIKKNIKKLILPCEIDDKETLILSRVLADVEMKIIFLQKKKKDTTKEINQQINDLRDMVKDLSETISTGKKNKDVECSIDKDYSRGTIRITRLDTGWVIEDRLMTTQEKQM